LTDICQEILDLLAENLIPACKTDEAKVFFYKMKADYYRYISEYSASEKKNQSA
jgi:14-3-3 protein epsilon